MLSKNTYFRQFLVLFSPKLSENLGMIMKGGFLKKYKTLCFLLFEKKSSQEKTRGHTTI